MAIEKTIIIKGDTKQAQKSFEQLGDTIDEQKKITNEFEQELLELERQLKRTSKTNLPAQKKLTKEIDKRKDAIKDNRLALKNLNRERAKVKGINAQRKATARLNRGYFNSKESLTDLNRLTAEFALKVKAVRNIMVGSVKAVINFVRGLSALKTALLATGVGALVVALGLIVVFWDDILEAVTGVNKELEKQIELNKKQQEIAGERLETNKLIKELLESEGKDTKQILEDRKKLLEAELGLVAVGITQLANKKSQIIARALDLSLTQKALNLLRAAQGQPLRIFTGLTDKEAERLKQLDIDLVNLGQRAIEIRTAINNINKAEEGEEDKKTGKGKGRRRVSALTDTEFEEELDLARVRGKAFAVVVEESTRKLNENLEELRQEDIKAADDAAKTKQKIAELEFKNKIGLLRATSSAIQAASDVLGEETSAGKALAITASLINTYTGIAASLKIGGPLGIAQAIATGLVGFKAVKDIIAVPVPNEVGVNVNAQTPQSTQVSPQFNIVGASQTNQLAESIAQQQQIPVKAFVVSKDMSSQQELDRNIEETATFG